MAEEKKRPSARKSAKAARKGNTPRKGRTSKEAKILRQPEDEPIVVDNPNFRIDLLNAKGGPGGAKKLKRDCTPLEQLVIFDSEGAREFFFIDLDLNLNSKVELVLEGGERIGFDVTTTGLEVDPSRMSEFVQNGTSTQFILDREPTRRIIAFVCDGEDLVTGTKFKSNKETSLSANGRHVVMLIPGPKRFLSLALNM